MADKITIKNWFKTGLKPTQEQFWAWIDSFWHKDEKIPITAIDDIENILNAKADAESLSNHLADANAHPELLAQFRIIPQGQFLIFKYPGNSGAVLETNDSVIGYVEGQLLNSGTYYGGGPSLLSSYQEPPEI